MSPPTVEPQRQDSECSPIGIPDQDISDITPGQPIIPNSTQNDAQGDSSKFWEHSGSVAQSSENDIEVMETANTDDDGFIKV